MGGACSRSTAAKRARRAAPECSVDSCRLSNYQREVRESYDSCELPMTPARSGGRKILEMRSFLGRAGLAGFERAVEVFDTLGSTMSNLNPNSSFATSMGIRGNKISILAFEVANTIAKGSNLLKSLSNESIQLLKDEVLQSDGVINLVSTDTKELLLIVAADKREEFNIFSREVIRFGDICKDPTWHNLGRYFDKLDSEFAPEEHSKEDIETTMQQLMDLARNTSELYHELHALGRFEQDYRKRFHVDKLPDTSHESLMFLDSEFKDQSKVVKGLKKKSLWSRSLEEVVEKLVDIVVFLHKEIMKAFGTHSVDYRPKNNQTLGVSGLALHYANIINQIDSMVSRPFSLSESTRGTLYHGLPANVKGALRSRLGSDDLKEEFTVAQIKTEMQKTLKWIVPVAENTVRAHQGFGWVGEWANLGTEVNKKPGQQNGVSRVQTMYYADKAATEECILDLVVWLHRLVIQLKSKGSCFRSSPSMAPIRPHKSRLPLEEGDTGRDVSDAACSRDGGSLGCEGGPPDFEARNPKLELLGRSRSHECPSTRREQVSQASLIRSRSLGSSTPSKEDSRPPASDVVIKKTKVLDVLDGLETLEAFPSAPICG